MSHAISRRSLLAAGAAFAVAAACGGKDDEKSSGSASGSTTSAPASNSGPDDFELLIASAQLVAATDQRVTFGVLVDNEPLKAPTVQVAFGPSFDRVGAFQPAELHSEGIEGRPYFRTTYRFDKPGQYAMVVDNEGKRGGTAVEVIDANATEVPLVGEQLIPVATPTTADPRGVDPICTRNPPCPFHTASLDDALKAGKPVVAIFSTPALCQSRVCGPVLDVLVKESESMREQVEFVHVEVWKSMNVDFSKAESLTPGMQAYHLTFEPIAFFADDTGKILERLDGPFDALECRDALSALVA